MSIPPDPAAANAAPTSGRVTQKRYGVVSHIEVAATERADVPPAATQSSTLWQLIARLWDSSLCLPLDCPGSQGRRPAI